MPRLRSQIPTLKSASSCGNLSQPVMKKEKPMSHHGSRRNLQMINASGIDRSCMLDASTPITHRRMFINHYVTRPPWAIDETISPFDREPEKVKSRKNINRLTQSEYGIQTNNLMEPISVRVESPSPSLDYMQDSLPRDECDRTNSPFGNESYYKSEIQRYVVPSTQVNYCQTDLTGDDLNYPNNFKNKTFQPISTQNKPEKRLVLPLKELKRTNQKNYATYKINNKAIVNNEPVDFNKVFNIQDRLVNHTDEDIQSRIDYWLNKSITADHPRSDKPQTLKIKEHSEVKKPIYRNQITFTPRPLNNQYLQNGNPRKEETYSSNPQIVEAVIFDSDSGSEKDYIVSSRSMEGKLNRHNSHFTIRANFTSKPKPSNSEIQDYRKCEVCGFQLSSQDEMKDSKIQCHKNCFKCFWCKKKLSLESYKVNIDKLCCPLHYRLLSN